MNLETEILHFIEYSGEINSNSIKTLFLWNSPDDKLEEFSRLIGNSSFDQCLESLISKRVVIIENETLKINFELLKKYVGYTKKMEKDEKSSFFSYELKWFGKITGNLNEKIIPELVEILNAMITSTGVITSYLPSKSENNDKILIDLRYLKINCVVSITLNSFSIISRSTYSQIPEIEGEKKPSHPIKELPKDPELLITNTSPNISANYFIFNLLNLSLKKLDGNLKATINSIDLLPGRGKDMGYDDEISY